MTSQEPNQTNEAVRDEIVQPRSFSTFKIKERTQKNVQIGSFDGAYILREKMAHFFFKKPLFNNLHSQNVWPIGKEFPANNHLLSSSAHQHRSARFSRIGIKQDPCPEAL